MKIKKIAIFLLLVISFSFVNVNAVESTNSYDYQIENSKTSDNDYLPPVDPSGYEIHDDALLTDGGTFHPITIWSFRIVVILIIASIVVLYKKKKNNYDDKERRFYEE